jgi:hypothetical protein
MNQCADQSSTDNHIDDIRAFIVENIIHYIENILYCTESQSNQDTEKNEIALVRFLVG